MTWGPENEAMAQAEHVERVLAGEPPELDGWDGEHGRVGIVSRWDDADERAIELEDLDPEFRPRRWRPPMRFL